MKFLIFNIIVFCSLGYLLTSKPNENFNTWFGQTKNKISKISQKDIISSIQKATAKNNQEDVINKNTSQNIKENIQNLLVKNKVNKNIIENDIEEDFEIKTKQIKANSKIQEIIDKVIAGKKLNDLDKSKNTLDKRIKVTSSNSIQTAKNNEVNIINKYMSNEERGNALAELITDMEMYHLNSLKN